MQFVQYANFELVCLLKLIYLPSCMQNLVNLHHFDIVETSIREMHRGIGKLHHLEHLDFFTVGKHKENGIKELGELSNLHGSLSIRKLVMLPKPMKHWKLG